MDDFAAQPGVANVYGLVGGEANAIAPGKRMLSSMSPTFLESADTVAIFGTPGGSRIITMVLQGVLATVERIPLEEWIAQPRIHHQYLPDRLEFESGALSESSRSIWSRRDTGSSPCKAPSAICRRSSGTGPGRVWAASDPRGMGRAETR
jgi:gamma-glutamyltranspeptidase / glutathione hydrolase